MVKLLRLLLIIPGTLIFQLTYSQISHGGLPFSSGQNFNTSLKTNVSAVAIPLKIRTENIIIDLQKDISFDKGVYCLIIKPEKKTKN